MHWACILWTSVALSMWLSPMAWMWHLLLSQMCQLGWSTQQWACATSHFPASTAQAWLSRDSSKSIQRPTTQPTNASFGYVSPVTQNMSLGVYRWFISTLYYRPSYHSVKGFEKFKTFPSKCLFFMLLQFKLLDWWNTKELFQYLCPICEWILIDKWQRRSRTSSMIFHLKEGNK